MRSSHRPIVQAVAFALLSASALAQETTDDVTELSDIEVTEDPMRVLPNEVSSSSFGFNKPLLETPRTVSFVSSEMMDLFGIAATEDLPSVVPGVYTLTRYGIQGGIDVRDVAADLYFRGMKRLNMEGHARTVLQAMDSLEVVKGPPSPIYGMGKIGGYTNMIPKSGRAKTGGYLSAAQGFAQAIIGAYDKGEFTFGTGGPWSAFGKKGGYYVFGLYENSDNFIKGVPVESKMGQAAVSLDDVIGSFRLEAGVSAQVTRTAGAALGRLTQDVVDTGRYIRGMPLINLDLNGNGSIGWLEQNQASPVVGNLSSGNLPLLQNFALPRDPDGNPYPINQVPVTPGIPENFYNYLVQQCGGVTETSPSCPDPTGLIRAQGIGGPQPLSGHIPLGFFLDPRTIGYDTLDLRRFASFEREQEGKLLTVFADLIYDVNPDFTIKNQLFFDGIRSYKLSDMGLYGPRSTYTWEDKITVTKRLDAEKLPDWLRVNTLASINYRETRNDGRRGGSFYNDPSANRTDAMAPTWVDSRGGMTPNTTFVACGVNPVLEEDGAPCNNGGTWSKFSEFGLGVMADIDMFTKLNLLVGGRIDGSDAKNIEYGGTFNPQTGTSADPGRFRPSTHVVTEGFDRGTSWTASLSYQLPFNVRPYATMARSSLTLDSSANGLSATVIRAGHIGEAELKEAGVKASLFGNKLFFTFAGYEQSRISVASPDDPTALAEVTSTFSEGWEAELKWVPLRSLFVSLYARDQKTIYKPNTGVAIAVNARALGFQDVIDPATGEVIFPAEAFLYGGRAQIVLPPGEEEYERQQGRPETQMGLNANYEMPNGLGFTLSGNYLSSVYSGRLRFIELPSSTTFNAGVFYDVKNWRVKLDVYNLTDERSFRSQRLASGEVLAIANPDRRWQLTLKMDF